MVGGVSQQSAVQGWLWNGTGTSNVNNSSGAFAQTGVDGAICITFFQYRNSTGASAS